MGIKYNIVVYGLGPIGSAVTRLVAERPNLNLVGLVDIDLNKAGKDGGEVVGLEKPLGFKVQDKLEKVLDRHKVDCVLHCTNSYFDLFKSQVLEILDAGLDIVSTSEELSFPWLAHPKEAVEIDSAAKKAGKTVMATGVNPGFLMDSLPLNITAICQRVDRVDIKRAQNATKRRGPFQAKIGSGLTVEAFNAKMAEGRMGHVGLPESVGMIFDTLGKKLVRFEDVVEPVVAEKTIKTPFFEVKPGFVRGLKQVARGFSEQGEFLTLTFIAALDHDEDQSTIIITGKPDLIVTLQGTNGDIATVAIAVNSVRRVVEAPPGLLTMRDLPIITLG